jgi:hypothetical protein
MHLQKTLTKWKRKYMQITKDLINDIPETSVEVEHQAGTGFMLGLAETIRNLSEYGGYTCNLTAKEDHFEADSGKFKLFPKNFEVDKMVRFENASDPDDNSILYAISDSTQNLRGLFVEGYGANQVSMSHEMLEKLKEHATEPSHVPNH